MVEAIEYIEDALTIPIPSSGTLVLDDCRRLTGPGLLWNEAGAVLDVFFQGHDTERLVKLWQIKARCVLDGIGWQGEKVIARTFEGGANLAISAPMDQLYSAIFAVQTAWHFVASSILSTEPGNFDKMIDDLKGVMAREANQELIQLIDAAQTHGVEALADDDNFSIGHGKGSITWPVSKLPKTGEVAWENVSNVPVALITGTNGKTTTTRLSSSIAAASGLVSGLTSTDFIQIGDDILERGDYSGPGGARILLRDQRLEIAFLEVARGGILRRGLPLRLAQAALVTNVAADHLGQFGVNTVEELAQVKIAVHRALANDGILVLNADDPYIVTEAERIETNNIWWFSLDRSTSQISQALESGSCAAWLEDSSLVFFDGKNEIEIIDIANIPLTLNGAARYNIRNALGALCLSRTLGIGDEAIRQGLSEFQNDPRNNPGRCNEFLVKGARVFVDFAHNPHSISAVAQAMLEIPAKRKFVLLGHAGDRSDQDIRDVTKTAFSLKPDFVVAAELQDYLRGREWGEITDMIRKECLVQGLSDDHVILANSPTEGVARIIDLLEPGDLALLLVLSERDKVFELLERFQ
ncbi:MAG: Mur ligase [Hyphomicrobiales bacterium]|nr:Mur ligase [Hyphomicrobiales bacterium]